MRFRWQLGMTQLGQAPVDESRFGQAEVWIWRGWRIHTTYQPTLSLQAVAPILLIHGFGASIGHWRHNIQALSQYRSVYAIDLLGFGASEKPVIEYTIDLWVDLVRDFWQHKIQRPAVVIGHSVGGLVALQLAAQQTAMVKGLCLISCADGPHPEELPPPFDCLVQGLCEGVVGLLQCPLTYPYLFDWLRQKDTLRNWIRNVYIRTDAVDDDLVTIFREPALDPNAGNVFIEALRAILTRRFLSPKQLLPQVQAPILLLWGKDDPAVPSFLADQFKRWQPDLKLVKLAGIGHCAHDELPYWVNALIAEWAASLEVVDRLPVSAIGLLT